ncbi:hypothetical protein RDABS01_013341 [Bienertia sinuspersici]
MFSPNTLPDLRSTCKNALGKKDTNAIGKYLGSQIEVSGRSLTDFWDLVTKLRKKLSSSEHLCLSPAGRLLFANAILVSLYTNILSVFLMPKYISKELNSIIGKFWWNGDIGWANGTSPVLRPNSVLTKTDLVYTLIDPCTSSWKPTVIWSNFTPESARFILSTHIPNSATADMLYWTLTPTGTISIKSAYRFLTKCLSMGLDGRSTCNSWKYLWKMHIPSKWKVFLWKLIWNALPLHTNLLRRGVQAASFFPFSEGCEETNEYLFRDCTVVRYVWSASILGLYTEAAQPIPLGTWIQNLLLLLAKGPNKDNNSATELVIALWAIWNHRNKIVFEAVSVSLNTILQLSSQFRTELATFRGNKPENPGTHPQRQSHPPYFVSGIAHDPIEGYVWVDGSWKHG